MATLNPALREFWLTPARNRVLYGGRSSSKSWDAAGFVIFLAQQCKIRVLCVRQFQNKISESVYALLIIQIERFRLQDKFTVLQNRIICIATGSEFMFYGLWRHIAEIKSIESIDILWSEESHLLSEVQWKILEPTIRKEGSQCWFIFNPNLATDFVYRRLVVNPPPDTIVRKINYDENPFLSSTMLKIIEAAKIEDEEEYNHIYLGVPRDNDDEAIIKRTHIMSAINAHIQLDIQPSGARRIGFDVADDGEDYCAMIQTHGSLANWADLWKAKEDELLKSCSRVWQRAHEHKAQVVYDAIGVGATSGAKFNELNASSKTAFPVQHSKFFAGGAPFRPNAKYGITGISNRDYFSNIKSQAWWLVADRLRNTHNAIKNGQEFKDDEMIFISDDMPHLIKLIDELTTPKRNFDLAGRVKVESKDDLKKRDIKSPNLADAFIMSYAPGVQPPMKINRSMLSRA
jgi:phage terminase large subunit